MHTIGVHVRDPTVVIPQQPSRQVILYPAPTVVGVYPELHIGVHSVPFTAAVVHGHDALPGASGRDKLVQPQPALETHIPAR